MSANVLNQRNSSSRRKCDRRPSFTRPIVQLQAVQYHFEEAPGMAWNDEKIPRGRINSMPASTLQNLSDVAKIPENELPRVL